MIREERQAKPIIHTVVRQHVDEAATLYTTRAAIVAAPSITLRDLGRLDDRLLAHLDGVAVAGDEGWQLCEAALDEPSAGAMFTAAVLAVDGQKARLDRLFPLCDTAPETRAGLIFALGWLEPQRLQGVVVNLLNADDPAKRSLGIAACGIHRVDPGAGLESWTRDQNRDVRALALRTVGELGRQDLAVTCAAAITDDDPECRAWGAWSAVLLGDRGKALEILTRMALHPGVDRVKAFCLVLQSQTRSTGAAHGLLQELATDAQQLRWLIHGSGVVGDPVYLPWLIKHMADDKTARLAGEAFSRITGSDFEKLKLDRERPNNFESGPNDDPDDPNVELDADDGLPWPDVEKIEKWWAVNESRFQKGARYFMGAAVTREHCIEILKSGYQRQRILAAHYLCLLEPGTPLFNTSAPAWRQQRLLATMA